MRVGGPAWRRPPLVLRAPAEAPRAPQAPSPRAAGGLSSAGNCGKAPRTPGSGGAPPPRRNLQRAFHQPPERAARRGLGPQLPVAARPAHGRWRGPGEAPASAWGGAAALSTGSAPAALLGRDREGAARGHRPHSVRATAADSRMGHGGDSQHLPGRAPRRVRTGSDSAGMRLCRFWGKPGFFPGVRGPGALQQPEGLQGARGCEGPPGASVPAEMAPVGRAPVLGGSRSKRRVCWGWGREEDQNADQQPT